jgi:hypothetical protein
MTVTESTTTAAKTTVRYRSAVMALLVLAKPVTRQDNPGLVHNLVSAVKTAPTAVMESRITESNAMMVTESTTMVALITARCLMLRVALQLMAHSIYGEELSDFG